MKMWSRGLGRNELCMDFKEYSVAREGDADGVQIIGTIKEPVNWEFKITIEPNDVPGMMKIFFNWSVIKLVLLNALKFIPLFFNRKNYTPEDNIEEKVNKAYEQMMRRAKPRSVSA